MKNVLIVDDDLGFQRLLGISLKKYKKEIETELKTVRDRIKELESKSK